VLIIVIKVSSTVIIRFINGCHLTALENRLNFGVVSRKDLSKASDSHFINWCLRMLQQMNFSSVDLVSAALSDDIQICGYAGKKKLYIRCIKCQPIANSKNADDFEKVGRAELQKLVGAMEHDRVKYAWVLTNGDFTSDAIDYAKTLPSTYKLLLINGPSLTRNYRHYQAQYATGL